MIRKTWNTDKWLLTAQTEHARVSAIIASSWNFPGERPSEQVFKAIMTHDDGWREADAAPMAKPGGDPRGFNEVKLAEATPIYTRSIELRKEAGHNYGAALVAGHFISLVENADLARASTADAKAAGQFLARQAANLKAIKAELEQDEASRALLENYSSDLRFLQVCDYLSLLLCTDFSGEEIIENVPYLSEGDILLVSRPRAGLSLCLAPLPFKKNLRDHLTSWILPYMPYDSTEELQYAMEEVKTTSNEVHFGGPSC